MAAKCVRSWPILGPVWGNKQARWTASLDVPARAKAAKRKDLAADRPAHSRSKDGGHVMLMDASTLYGHEHNATVSS